MQMPSDNRSSKFVCALCALLALTSLAGCRVLSHHKLSSNQGRHPEVPNPLIVPMMDRWLVMDQISDELDDYFKIYREERIRVMDGVMSEGWIETHPKIGGTLLEPWHRDSTRGFERLHATVQTVRRFAKVRVIPAGYSYQVDVKVFKELEELEQPLGSNVRGWDRTFSKGIPDNIDRADLRRANRYSQWIPLGRDFSLEQQILRNIQQRLTGIAGNNGPVIFQ